MVQRAGRHVARRWYTGVGARDVILGGSAILLAGSIMAGTVVAERYGPNLDGLAPTTVTVPTMTPSSAATTATTGPATAPTFPPASAPSGPPGPQGPPGQPGQVVTVTVPVPGPTAPPSTVGATTTVTPPTTNRPCITPPSRSHPDTTRQRPCLPR